MTDLLRTLDRSEKLLLERRGAAVTTETVTCDDNTLVRSVGRFKSVMLDRRGQRGYHAKAVHFAGRDHSFISGSPIIDTGLVCDSITSNDSADGAFSYSVWFKVASTTQPNERSICQVNPDGPSQFFLAIAQNLSAFGEVDNQSYFDSFCGDPDNFLDTHHPLALVVTPETWNHILGCVVGSPAGGGDAQWKLYYNDVDRTSVLQPFRYVGNHRFIPSITGYPFWVGQNNYSEQYLGDMADLWVAAGVNLLDGNGDIPLATRRRFIDANKKPVHPDLFPPGATVLMTGDASHFVNNRGSGGSFRLVTSAFGGLTDATTSPSD